MTHADVRELIGAYSLGALETDEMALVEEHLQKCGFCANLAREAAEVAHYLPYAAPFRSPPAGSLNRLLASVTGSLAAAPAPTRTAQQTAAPAGSRAESQPPRPRLGLVGRLARLLTGLPTPVLAPVTAAFVVVAGLATWNMSLMRELSDERRQMSALEVRLAQQTRLMLMVTSGSAVTRALAGTALAPSAEVRLIMDAESNSAMVMASQLPPLPSGRIYQVWLGRRGARMPAGRLVVDDQGNGECNLQLDSSVDSYDSAWITLEPAKGGPMPNSPGVAKGQL